jgi:hypothetical protein
VVIVFVRKERSMEALFVVVVLVLMIGGASLTGGWTR